MRIAPDSKTLTDFPLGPSGSMIAGILPFGLIFRNSGSNWWPLRISTIVTMYGSAISSKATLILRPFGVSKACSSIGIEHPCTLLIACIDVTPRRTSVGNVALRADFGTAMQIGLDLGEDYGTADLHVRVGRWRWSGTERVAPPAAQGRGARRPNRR